MKRVFVSLLTVGTMMSTATAAMANDVCMPGPELRASLIDWYGEEPVAAPNKAQQQIWASPRTGTWTKVHFDENGTACVLAQGDDWLVGAAREALLASLGD